MSKNESSSICEFMTSLTCVICTNLIVTRLYEKQDYKINTPISHNMVECRGDYKDDYRGNYTVRNSGGCSSYFDDRSTGYKGGELRKMSPDYFWTQPSPSLLHQLPRKSSVHHTGCMRKQIQTSINPQEGIHIQKSIIFYERVRNISTIVS